MAYDPDSDEGFVYIREQDKDHDEDIPIRIKTIALNENS